MREGSDALARANGMEMKRRMEQHASGHISSNTVPVAMGSGMLVQLEQEQNIHAARALA